MSQTKPLPKGFPGLVEFAQRLSPDLLPSRFVPPPVDKVQLADPVGLPPQWLVSDNVIVVPVREGFTIETGATLPRELRDHARVTDPHVLAYYLPYHFYKKGVWGIYLRAAGIAWLADELGRTTGSTVTSAIEAAISALWAHEYYHCVVETAVTRVELVPLLPTYGWYFADGVSHLHEEAMCNAFAYQYLRRRHAEFAPALRSFMEHQSTGYSEFAAWLGSQFAEGRNLIAKAATAAFEGGYGARPDRSIEYFVSPAGIPARAVPLRVVVERDSSDVLRPFPAFNGARIQVHALDHPPPHFHLESPVGQRRGSFVWPTLEPVRDTRPLTASERRRVNAYLAKHGGGIAKKIADVYGASAAAERST